MTAAHATTLSNDAIDEIADSIMEPLGSGDAAQDDMDRVLMRRFARACIRAASAPAGVHAEPAGDASMPVMAHEAPDDEQPRVVTEHSMAIARKDGGASLSSMRPYCNALVRQRDAQADIAALKARIAEMEGDASSRSQDDGKLEREIERLRELLAQKLAGETMLRDFSLNGGGLEMHATGGPARLLAEMLAQQYVDAGGQNYIEVRFASEQAALGESFVVTVQRVGGLTPAQKLADAEARIAKMKNALRTIASEC